MLKSIAILFALIPFLSFSQERPNILFIAIDDLNDWVGVLGGHPNTKTPNIDALANSGMFFTNAHCQAPICGPSRASVLSGLYPTTSGNYLQLKDTDIKKSNDATSNVIMMPDYFEQHGYKTMGVGKIFHRGDGAGVFEEFGSIFDSYGPRPPERINYDPEKLGKPGGTSTDWGAYPADDSLMTDFKSAQWAVKKLNTNHEKPFFLAVGFYRPHVPWYVPQKWFDRFPLEDLDTPPYLANDMDDVPDYGKRITDVPMMPTTEWLQKTGQWKDVIQAYLASINFVDTQVGKVLDALKQSRYANNTIIVLWSDHGYHLGEKNRFAKQALWERDTKTVLIFKEPDAIPNRSSNKPVQLLDIYPTLIELAGLPGNQQNEGHSLASLLKSPSSNYWPHVAMTAFGKNNIAISDERFRLIQYADNSIELYDLQKDPNEWDNLADNSRYKDEIKRLRKSIPDNQAELSKYSIFNLNNHWREVIESNKKTK